MHDDLIDARRRIALAAAELAERAVGEQAPEQDRLEAVKCAAEAVCNVAFGPQGGEYDRHDDGVSAGRMDYHMTSHPGAPRERPAGFAGAA